MAFVYAEQHSWNSRKAVALAGAIAVNVGFLAAMQSGLVFEAIEAARPMVVVPVPLDPVPPEPAPIPPPDPFKLVLSVPDVPPPLRLPPIEVQQPPIATGPAIYGDPSGSATAPMREPAITQLQANQPLTPPDYPSTSIRRSEEGTVRLLIYVLPDGRVGDVKVDRSSGYPRLDKAAMDAARKYWTFKPAAQGGTPFASWGYFAVTFDLKD